MEHYQDTEIEAADAHRELDERLALDITAGWSEPIGLVDPRTVPVRFSNLKRMGQSPLHYLYSVQNDIEDTLALRIGRGSHALVTGQKVKVFMGKVRNGKVWDCFKAEHADSVILNAKEYCQARSVAYWLERHKAARKLLFENTVLEERIDWKYLGRDCRSTPDVRGGPHVTEIKSTRCSEPARFNRDGLWRAYHAQLAFYLDSVLTSHLGTPQSAFIIAVESLPPHPVSVLRLTERAIELGRRMCRLWFERLLASEAEDYWPAYIEGEAEFDAPEELELTFGGESLAVAEDGEDKPAFEHVSETEETLF